MPRRRCRGFFVTALIVSFIFMGSGLAGASQHMCRALAGGGHPAGAAGCCCGAGEKCGATCAGVAAGCVERAQGVALVSVSNAESPALQMVPALAGTALPGLKGGHAAVFVIEHQVVHTVIPTLLC